MSLKKISFLFLLFLSFNSAGFKSDKYYPFGLEISSNIRRGFLHLPNGELDPIEKKQFYLPGIFAGKRYLFNDLLRLQILGSIGIASVNEDTSLEAILLDNGEQEYLVTRVDYIHVGLEPELQYVLPIDNTTRFIVGVGTGVHYMNMKENEVLMNADQLTYIKDPLLIKDVSFSASGSTRLGLELYLSKRIGLHLGYVFRYWHPITYDYSRDLFLYKSLKYHERFFTHSLQVAILLYRM